MQRFVCTTTAMGGRTAPCDFPLLHGGGTKIQMWVNGTKKPPNGGKKVEHVALAPRPHNVLKSRCETACQPLPCAAALGQIQSLLTHI